MQKDGASCPGCGLSNYEGLCPHCRGDQDAYERELVPPFQSSRTWQTTAEACGETGDMSDEEWNAFVDTLPPENRREGATPEPPTGEKK
jgi:hypothetical protein